MVCIYCASETKVINSRPQKRSNQIWRRRRCLVCPGIFTSEEAINYSLAWLVSGRGGLTPFSRDKLFISLYNSLQHRPTAISDAGALAETIIKKLAKQSADGHISSRTISRHAAVTLNRFDTVAGVHYQAYHK